MKEELKIFEKRMKEELKIFNDILESYKSYTKYKEIKFPKFYETWYQCKIFYYYYQYLFINFYEKKPKDARLFLNQETDIVPFFIHLLIDNYIIIEINREFFLLPTNISFEKNTIDTMVFLFEFFKSYIAANAIKKELIQENLEKSSYLQKINLNFLFNFLKIEKKNFINVFKDYFFEICKKNESPLNFFNLFFIDLFKFEVFFKKISVLEEKFMKEEKVLDSFLFNLICICADLIFFSKTQKKLSSNKNFSFYYFFSFLKERIFPQGNSPFNEKIEYSFPLILEEYLKIINI